MTHATLTLVFMALTFKYLSISALTVNVPGEIICVNGERAVFSIEYSLESGDTFNSVTLRKDLQDVFTAPAFIQGSFLPNGSFSGAYQSRGNTDYYVGKTRFTITLLHVSPGDEGNYTVQMTKNNQVAVRPAVTRLIVDFIPGTPSISGAPTQPVIGGAGATVLTCRANLGKPEASMVWSRRIGNAAPYTNITENVTTATTSNGNGTTNGTSTLTVYLDANDDGVQFRCQISNRQGFSFVETKTIIVTEPKPVIDSNVQVCRLYTAECSSSFEYSFGDQFRLICLVNPSSLDVPNPLPHSYRWRTVSSGDVIPGNLLLEKAVEPSAEYECIASNIVRGVDYSGSKKVTVNATDHLNPTDSPASTSLLNTTENSEPIHQETLSCGAVAGIVVGACLAVFLIFMVIVAKRRGVTLPGINRKSRTPKMSHDIGSIEMKKVDAISVEPDDGHVGPALSEVDPRCDEDDGYADMNGPSNELDENVTSELPKGIYVNVRVPIYEGLTEVPDGAAAVYTQLEANESSRNYVNTKLLFPHGDHSCVR